MSIILTGFIVQDYYTFRFPHAIPPSSLSLDPFKRVPTPTPQKHHYPFLPPHPSQPHHQQH
jgi:hypothetical protein